MTDTPDEDRQRDHRCLPGRFATAISSFIFYQKCHKWNVLFTSKEDIVASLKSLTLTALPQIQADPVMDRRNRTIAHLEEQKRLLQDPSYARTVKVWIEKDGERQQVEKKQRVFPWWRILPNGSAVLTIRVAQKPIEFEKGKAGIAVASADKLPSVLDTVITAIRNGELDEQLAHASRAVPSRKKKAA
jgi:hypothetical protein